MFNSEVKHQIRAEETFDAHRFNPYGFVPPNPLISRWEQEDEFNRSRSALGPSRIFCLQINAAEALA